MNSSRRWSDHNSTSSSLPPLQHSEQNQTPKLMRLKDASQEAKPVVPNRRTSKLPTVQRKNSLVAFEPMVAKFVKNGDRFFEGVQLNISPRVVRSWEVLLAELSHRVDLPAGVRKIYTPENGHRINSLSELEHHKVYVCASTEPFKRIDYSKLKNPDWKSSRPRPSEVVPPSIFAKSFPAVPGDLGNSFGTTVSSIGDVSFEKGNDGGNRKRRQSRTRRPSRLAPLSSITEVDTPLSAPEANIATNQLLSPTSCNAKPTVITIYQNGPPPRYNVPVYFNREAIRSWEEAKKLIRENLPGANGVLRLYQPNGEEVQSVSQLWRAGSMLIAAGKEKFDIAEFLAGAGAAPAPAPRQLHQSSAEKPTGTALPIRSSMSTEGSVTGSNERLSTVCEVGEVGGANSRPVRRRYSEGYAPFKGNDEKMKQLKDNRESKVAGEVEKTVNGESANMVEQTGKPVNFTIGDHATKEPATSPDQPDKCVNEEVHSSHVTAKATPKDEETQIEAEPESQLRGEDTRSCKKSPDHTDDIERSDVAEVHPEPKTRPTVGFVDPLPPSRRVSESITPAVSPVESPAAAATRPRSLSFIGEKYAGLFSHSNRPGSTSSSSDLLESPLFAARRRLLNQRGFPNPLVQPQTPQSEISLGVCQSVVDMLLPRPVDYGVHSDIDSSVSSTSSDSTQYKRNIGIQTQCDDNRLSSMFESDHQQPRHKDQAKISHSSKWMMESQTHLALKSLSLSQFDDSFHSSKQTRERYQVGMTLSEGHFAVVKQCKEKTSERECLLRVINKAKVYGREDLILREVTVMKMLRQENVMQVVDHWETSDDMCLVMEDIKGSDLFDAILNCQHFSESDASTAVRQLGLALVYLHANQIVHRDVKPENIFLALDSVGGWSLKLGGFSLAAVATEPLSLICGNPYYRAPEMVMETGYGTKVDVWAAGVITYLLICGSLPFGRKSRSSLTSNTLMGKVSFPSCFWSNISKEVKDFVKHLMKVSPSQRYSSSEMLQHPWIRDPYDTDRHQSVESAKLIEYLNSRASASPNLTTVPVLAVTALDHHSRGMARLKHTSTSEDIER